MMTVNFTSMEITTYLQCRRGRNVYRKVRIDIGMRQAIYPALPQSSIEMVDGLGYVWARADIRESQGSVTLDYQGPPTAKANPKAYAKQEEFLRGEEANAILIDEVSDPNGPKEVQKVIETSIADKANAFANKEADERTTAPEPDQRPKTEDNDDMQQVGRERDTDGQTIRRSLHVQVPLVGSSDARFERTEERGSESGPDGLHSNDDESNVLDDRYAARIRSLSTPDEDAGRD